MTWEDNIQFFTFESPELTRLKEVRRRSNKEKDIRKISNKGHKWQEYTQLLHQVIDDRYLKIDEKILDERRQIAREAGLLFDDPSGLHCEKKHPVEVSSISFGKNERIKNGGSDYRLYFCIPCLEEHLEFLGDYLKAERYLKKLDDLKKTGIVDKEELYSDRVGYHCSSCGVVKGEPRWDESNKGRLIYRCLICDEHIGEYIRKRG
jgi:hypothetical protein